MLCPRLVWELKDVTDLFQYPRTDRRCCVPGDVHPPLWYIIEVSVPSNGSTMLCPSFIT